MARLFGLCLETYRCTRCSHTVARRIITQEEDAAAALELHRTLRAYLYEASGTPAEDSPAFAAIHAYAERLVESIPALWTT